MKVTIHINYNRSHFYLKVIEMTHPYQISLPPQFAIICTLSKFHVPLLAHQINNTYYYIYIYIYKYKYIYLEYMESASSLETKLFDARLMPQLVGAVATQNNSHV